MVSMQKVWDGHPIMTSVAFATYSILVLARIVHAFCTDSITTPFLSLCRSLSRTHSNVQNKGHVGIATSSLPLVSNQGKRFLISSYSRHQKVGVATLLSLSMIEAWFPCRFYKYTNKKKGWDDNPTSVLHSERI